MPIGPLMMDLKSVALSQEEKALLQHPLIGGVIFFSRNFQSPEQLLELTSAIKMINPDLLLAVDQEGGRVQRFKEGFTRLPAMRNIGQLYDELPQEAAAMAQICGWLMASEVLAVGFDFSFAPVLDLDLGLNEAIGNRAFHSDPVVVSELAMRFMQGMEEAGMAAVGKHFPGHGSVAADSHYKIPVSEESKVDLVKALYPFKQLIQSGIKALMPAHIIFNKLDLKPVGCSQFWLQQILRKELGFKGLIFSDDLSMAGASAVGGIKERCQLALEAGCDMLLICNDRDAVENALDALSGLQLLPKQARLLEMKARRSVSRDNLIASSQWQRANEQILRSFQFETQ